MVSIFTSLIRRFSSSRSPQRPPLLTSPARLRKLISSQRDPLLAKEIYDLAASLRPDILNPSSPSSYTPLHSLIVHLTRHSRRLSSAALSLLRRLPSPSPGLFTALFTAVKPHPPSLLLALRLLLRSPATLSLLRPRHVNRIISALATHRSSLPAAISTLSNPSLPTDTHSYTILIRGCAALSGHLALACSLFNRMISSDITPDPEAYRAIIQGLCRRSQVSTATGILEDMLHKGRSPDALACTTLLNSLCRKKQLHEAYKLLCKMRTRGCAPDIVHYNTVIAGFCRESRPMDACKVLDDMAESGCQPNLVSYSVLVNGLAARGFLEQAKSYLQEMERRGLVGHFSLFHAMVKGFYNRGEYDDAFVVLEQMLRQQVVPHLQTWQLVVPAACAGESELRLEWALQNIIIINRGERGRQTRSIITMLS